MQILETNVLPKPNITVIRVEFIHKNFDQSVNLQLCLCPAQLMWIIQNTQPHLASHPGLLISRLHLRFSLVFGKGGGAWHDAAKIIGIHIH